MTKISVIIPVFNTEKYLEKCLNSVINQTFKDIEIICIDDGSTDNSYNILDKYSKKDNRIKLLKQENAKQGAARNRGLEIARGEYITFVDSDDWIEPNYCELLYNAAKKYNVNIAAATTIRDYKNKTKKHLELKEEKVYSNINSTIQALEYNFFTSSKLYRFEPIKELRFEENVFYEDGPYTIKALHKCNSLVTVPEAIYHYISNPKSTIKQRGGIKNENDKISTSLELIDYAQKHNIDINDSCIYKENHTFWGIKHYINHKDYYFCGLKIISIKKPFNREKVFLVFNTACFGDVLLCNSLCQNIKYAFPNSKIVFIVDKAWEDVAKYQKCVDDVVVYDKRGIHKGILGIFKFIKNFKYKKPFAVLLTYFNGRNFIIGKLLKSRFVLKPLQEKVELNMQFRHSKLLQSLTNKKIRNYPLKYELPNNIENPLAGEKYIALCCITKNTQKDMPFNITLELIKLFNKRSDYKVVLTGRGDLSVKYAQKLKDNGADFINLVNKTSILELGAVLKGSEGLISCDTGTMHYGYSLGVPTVAVFYQIHTLPIWAPSTEIYNNVLVINENQTAQNIYDMTNKLLGNIEVLQSV